MWPVIKNGFNSWQVDRQTYHDSVMTLLKFENMFVLKCAFSESASVFRYYLVLIWNLGTLRKTSHFHDLEKVSRLYTCSNAGFIAVFFLAF